MAAVFVCDAMHHRKSQAATISGSGRVKRHENRSDIALNADAGVGHLNHMPAAMHFRETRCAVRAVVGLAQQAHGNQAAIGHRIPRVETQIDNGLLQTIWINVGDGVGRGRYPVETMLRGQRRAQNCQGAFRDCAQRDFAGVAAIATAVGEQLIDQFGRAPTAALNFR